jgi:hypothetical protein
MPILPTPSGGSSQAGRLDGRHPVANAARGPSSDPAAAGPGSDRIEVSDIARQLAGLSDATAVPELDLAPERVREIAGRMANGFYERPEIQSAVIGRLFREL